MCHIYIYLHKNVFLFGHISLYCVIRMRDEKVNMEWFKRYHSDSKLPCFFRKNPLGNCWGKRISGGDNSWAKLWVYEPGQNISLALGLVRQGWEFVTSSRNKITSFDFVAWHRTLWNPTQTNEKLWIYCHLIIASCSVRSKAFSSLFSLFSTTNSH